MSYHPLTFDALNILLFDGDAVVIVMETAETVAGAAVVAEASASIIAWTADVETVDP